jgi:hypothetical protein
MVAEADGGIGGDRALAVQNIGDAACRHADVESELISTQSTRLLHALGDGQDGPGEALLASFMNSSVISPL